MKNFSGAIGVAFIGLMMITLDNRDLSGFH